MSSPEEPHKPLTRRIVLDTGMHIEQDSPLVAILGPCVIESRDHTFRMVEAIAEICQRLDLNFVFKSSFDKANRSSKDSYRGLGMLEGLTILQMVKDEFKCPVTTDVHEPDQCLLVGSVVDILQIPAFLCRQTDLLIAAGEAGKPVNIKKGQFVAPWDMKYALEKVYSTGNKDVILTERGATFGYNNLVVDFRSLLVMREFGVPICFDATHSTQLPGGGQQSGGERKYAPYFARAAAAVGIDVLFMEVHDNPERALSDGSNQLPLSELERTLRDVIQIRQILQSEMF